MEENRMRESKSKICKMPKCQKEIPGKKGVFCSEHSKSVKENGNIVAGSILGLASLAIITITKGKD